jgi:hypothetical protein
MVEAKGRQIAIRCAFTKLEHYSELLEHRKNRNTHPQKQITKLADLIAFQGFRHPIIVSNLSGQVVAGHGRLAAAKFLGMEQVPVDYQDFVDEAAEYAFLISDNAIGLWGELELGLISTDLADLGPDFDVGMLGIENFRIDPAENYIESMGADQEIIEVLVKTLPIHKGEMVALLENSGMARSIDVTTVREKI